MLTKITCSQLTGIGPQMASKLANVGIYTVADLLFCLPSRYLDRSQITLIKDLVLDEFAVIEGRVVDAIFKRAPHESLMCRIEDETGYLLIRFLHFSKWHYKKLNQKNKKIRLYGIVKIGKFGFEIIHPEYQLFNFTESLPLEKNLTAIYPAIGGLSQTFWRKTMQQALALMQKHPFTNGIPVQVMPRFEHLTINDAFFCLHSPDVNTTQATLNLAKQRLEFEELLAYFLGVYRLRSTVKKQMAPQFFKSSALLDQFIASLPFALTNAQIRVIAEIQQDLASNHPMLRLLQGDVGSGKTIVAVAAALQAIENGWQVAIMAPTEILAEQHYANFLQWLQRYDYKIVCLTGKMTAKTRRENLQLILSGSAKIIIGTHAIFQKDVTFAKLALVVIDEQHKFGVHQRLALREKGTFGDYVPHQLIMTATPIPRTLAMLAYADLDCSVIDELPKGREAVKTLLVSDQRRLEVVNWLIDHCRKGRQVYWVCPLINESEVLACQAAEETYVELAKLLPDLRINLLHGRLNTIEKKQIMQNFKQGDIDLLVATTVIEVGVDVANACLMVIENAERMGLAQLHQLRGRVGRGTTTSYCVLLYKFPLSPNARERLMVLRNSNDGFAIAQKDLELRGPGELLGTQQKGLHTMLIADIFYSQHLFACIKDVAKVLVQSYPNEVNILLKRWVDGREKYGSV